MPRKQTRAEYNEYMRVYILARYHRRRAEAKTYLGGKCQNCGATDDLDFDHIDRNTKVGSIAKIWSVSNERFWVEVEKCQLLCRPCHLAKSVEYGDTRQWHHGTTTGWYTKKCRCELCAVAHEKHLAARRERRHGRMR